MADGWWGTDGDWHAVDDDARGALREALGATEHPDGPPPGPAMWFLRPDGDRSVWSPGTLVLEDGTDVSVTDAVPPDVPIGIHRLVSRDGHETQVAVLPGPCRRAGRGWGWSAQLYGCRSAASWGHGDLGDLARLARWARDGGASLLAHNPLGATLPVLPQQPSPYYASSRRFWSPLYLRVQDVAGAELAEDAVARAAAAGRALDGERRIDRDRVWGLKLAALEAIWDQGRDRLAVPPRDEGLTRHAVFCALAEHHGGGRSTFPADVAHPDGPAVADFARDHADRVDFWRWVHHGTDQQLGRAASAGAPLMADLPVGFDPDGSDAWADQDLLAGGCRIGAPPDEFDTAGQDWGLPPYVPWKLRAAGYAPWLDTLRRVLRHAGALRVDHVMGLFRLYLIPPGASPREGGYVYQYGSELLDLACLEAARADAVLVGEDLGTVEGGVREAMSERGVYGYRVGWFEDGSPEDWPALSLASLTTHDLPTAAGLWSGYDAGARDAAGVAPDPDGDRLLHERLTRLAGDAAADPAPDPRAITLAAYGALAGAGSDLVVATLEDALGVVERPNLPGTVDQHPNWLLALPVAIEDYGAEGADALAGVLAAARPVEGR